MAEIDLTQSTPPSQVFVPVRADGRHIRDNGGDIIATCFTDALAVEVARLLNDAAGGCRVVPMPPLTSVLEIETSTGPVRVKGSIGTP